MALVAAAGGAAADTTPATTSVRLGGGAVPRADATALLGERGAAAFVWGVWALMLAVVLACIARYAHDIPLAEDWNMVAALTGHEPNLARWLWQQNNEHRLPAPRLVYLVLLEASGGDFRVGMVANTLIMAAVAAAMIRTARRLRGDRTSVTDAFFPLALLHLGHWENLVWGWQLQFVLSTALVCTLLLVVVRDASPPLAPGRALVAALALLVLPLCGANGLIFALAMAPWGLWVGVRQGRRRGDAAAGARAGEAWAGRVLAAASVLAVLLVGLYFVGYERPSWVPPNPGRRASLETALHFAAMALGPFASRAWQWIALGVVALLLPVGVLVARAAWRERGPERDRALGLFFFGGGTLVLTLAMGWGRAASVPTQGMPDRYALLATPALCAAYFVALLYAPRVAARAVQWTLLAALAAVLPGNVREGLSWRDWYVSGASAVERDIAAGVPRLELARRHRQYLLHWNESMLADRIAMLRAAGTGPFHRARE